MITNFKIFESNDDICFSVGDEVTCINGSFSTTGPVSFKKYIVMRIYAKKWNSFPAKTIVIEHQYVTKKDIDYFHCDVKDIETNIILTDWLCERFISELRQSTNKFNL